MIHPNKQSIHGILLLDKPLGLSSNGVLQKVKGLFQARKAGHTGALDPLASGLLPICFGEATKFSQFLLNADKEYLVTAKLGIRTNTADAEGEIIATRPVGEISQATFEATFDRFRGVTQQIPPMFSALKHKGQPLYKLARQGIEIERKPREITISSLKCISIQDTEFTLRVSCSKGTYIRTLVDDIGQALDCGAHVTALRRLNLGPFKQDQMITLDVLKQAKEQEQSLLNFLLPLDAALQDWPEICLTEEHAFQIKHGQIISLAGLPPSELVRLTVNGTFIGIGEILDEDRLAPKRLIST